MNADYMQVVVKGKQIEVATTTIADRTIIVNGRMLKIAAVRDEGVVEGEVVSDPDRFVSQLKQSRLKADVFTFAEKLPHLEPRFRCYYEWDNIAAIPISTFDVWWKKQIKDKTRNMVRKAQKCGLAVRVVAFDDTLVRQIMEIYNESPIRQGRPFWHYGKDFETVKRELKTYIERSHFIGAYLGDELVGFMKLVTVDRTATLFHFLSKIEHRDKSPMNALIAKAVELCAETGIQHLIYGKFTYGNKTESPLSDFKSRNAFEKMNLAKYYIPLTWKGKVALKWGLHRGLLGILPPRLVVFLVKSRARILQFFSKKAPSSQPGIDRKTAVPQSGSAPTAASEKESAPAGSLDASERRI